MLKVEKEQTSMVATLSQMLELGTKMPDFELENVLTQKNYSTKERLSGRVGTLVMFICNHCPYVKHLMPLLSQMVNQWADQGLCVLAINSNDVEKYPEDAPDKMQYFAHDNKFRFPYLFDETQEVAKNFHAACTPDFYLFDKEDSLFYRGRFDDSRPNGEIKVSGKDLERAVMFLFSEAPAPIEQLPSIGCNIKWKS